MKTFYSQFMIDTDYQRLTERIEVISEELMRQGNQVVSINTVWTPNVFYGTIFYMKKPL
jgi:hypothetical protein